MANTLLWYSACCTRGIEESSSSVGSPTVSTTVNSGDRSYLLNPAGTQEWLQFAIPEYDGTGMWTVIAMVRFSEMNQSGTEFTFLGVGQDGSPSNRNWGVSLQGDGDIVLTCDVSTSTISYATHGYVAGDWIPVRVDVEWVDAATGQIKLSVGASSASTLTSIDTVVSNGWGSVSLGGAGTGDGDVLFDCVAVWDTDTTFAPTDLPDTVAKSNPYQGADGTGFTTYTETGEGPDTGAIGDAGEIPIATGAGSEAYYNTGSVAKGEGVAADGSSRAGPSGDSDIGTILGAKYMYWLDRDGGGGTTYYAYYGTQDETGGAAWYTNMDVANPDVQAAYSWHEYLGDSADLPTTSEYLAMGVRADGARDLYIGEMFGSILYEPAGAPPAATGHHVHLPLLGVG